MPPMSARQGLAALCQQIDERFFDKGLDLPALAAGEVANLCQDLSVDLGRELLSYLLGHGTTSLASRDCHDV